MLKQLKFYFPMKVTVGIAVDGKRLAMKKCA